MLEILLVLNFVAAAISLSSLCHDRLSLEHRAGQLLFASCQLLSYALAAVSTGVVSTEMPGPMVDEIYAPLMYLPLAADGLALTTLVITAVAFSTSLSGVNEIFPTGTWTSAVLSVRNSTLPALISFTAFAMSIVTVPVLGFGIRPFGPRTLPSLPTDRIMSGVEITASKSVQLSFWIFSTISSPPTMSAPAASASRCFSPVAITRTFFDLPSPCGRTTVPRTIWSACLGSTPRRSVTSTVSSNLAYLTFCSKGTASASWYERFSTAARALLMFFPALRLMVVLPYLPPRRRKLRAVVPAI